MSVITECRPGDRFVCVRRFHACPDGESLSLSDSKRFQVGEVVRYVGFRQSETLKNHPESFLVVFEANNGKRYAATQTHFVTQDCWRDIARQVSRKLRARRRKSPANGSTARRK